MPFDFGFHLIAGIVKRLVKVAVLLQQGDTDHRDSQVSSRTQGVTGQYSQTAAKRWDIVFQSNFHREICNLTL